MPHHAHSIDRWDDATGSTLYEHLVGVNDLLLARATFKCRRELEDLSHAGSPPHLVSNPRYG
jgi:hypothetical protein